jgi:small subunit ribosomal protein S1
MPTRDDFAAMLNESLGGENESFEGRVVTGTVTAIENDLAVIDVGLKSEGRVPLREFAAPGQKAELNVGDKVEVYVDRVENHQGEAMLSRDRARREAAWDKLETEFTAGNRVEGVIFGRVKGGFTVDLGGAVAFLPGSQVDIRPVRDVTPLMDVAHALPDPQDGSPPRQHRRVAPRHPRGDSRRAAFGPDPQPRRRPGGRRRRQEHHRLRRLRRLGGIDGLLHVTDISTSASTTRPK